MRIKSLLFFIAASTLAFAACGQTLFTYNATPVGKGEFLKAFNKNPDTTGTRADKLKEYLGMYINFKLKLQAAYDEKLDTKDDFKQEAANFKNQLTENYINEQANISSLVHEAFIRSQKDILLSEVFIAVPHNADTTVAWSKIHEALAGLKAGKSFDDVTTAYTTDEGLKQQKGNMGYITVFSLPYQIENTVYALKPGEYSAVYRSSIGYHIFKNVGERPAVGKRKIQQILFPVAQAFNDVEKKSEKRIADSVYQLLQKGAQFPDLAKKFATSTASQQTNGIATVSTGMYSSDYESEVFNLQKPGDFTAPFATGYGYHIIKLLEVDPVPSKESDVISLADLQTQVAGGDRLFIAKNNLLHQWMVLTKYKKSSYDEAALWQFTDSNLGTKSPRPVKAISGGTVIFSFAKQNITAADWVKYVQSVRQLNGAQNKYSSLLQDFTNQSCNTYYRNHIEDYNPAISEQLKEFNEANLLFAVMDKHVWSVAAQDSAGLANYYKAHKEKYIWMPGVSALSVTASSKELADSLALKIKGSPTSWHAITSAYSNQVSADSSRYENGQLPVKQTVPMQPGYETTPEKNESGDAYVFVYVFDAYPQQSQRSFDDAKGMVVNDYQQILEDNWVAELKKKYPVKVNDAVFNTLK